MKLDFETNNLKGYSIKLQKPQIDIILDSLAFNIYTYKYIYPCKKPNTELESLRISFLRDTYCQILEQVKFHETAINRAITNLTETTQEKIKKIS